ncbi:MAG: prepilin peptidase [Candidatus Binatus sp.]|uniref:prepilin peptidase n=1 Tax=Candidatus Binatus sp. TaxID=2811406 RepID=UPI0027180C07|nr:A24 family peptidase [Candidatus Binatus sp.]MDO8433991.1 prepilin peptidase [Candidatus Binatus sp.]
MVLDLPTGIGGAMAFLIGASVGSFVNVVAWRMPRDLSIVAPRSFCESCERTLPLWANIPILAYIGLRGRCVMCGGAIPFRHFLSEAGLAVTALFLFLSFPLPSAIARFAFCAALWIVAVIDYDWRLIPNLITWPGTIIGFLAASLLMPEIGWKNSVLGILMGGGVLYLTGYFYQLVRGQEGVGMGDVWLLAMVGGFIGWVGVFFTLFFGSMLGAIGGIAAAVTGAETPTPPADPANEPQQADVSILRTEVPFGPFLALAAGIFTLFQTQLTHWYLRG